MEVKLHNYYPLYSLAFVALLNYRQYLSSLLLMVGAKAEKWVLSSNEKKLELSNEPDSIFSQLKDLNYMIRDLNTYHC